MPLKATRQFQKTVIVAVADYDKMDVFVLLTLSGFNLIYTHIKTLISSK